MDMSERTLVEHAPYPAGRVNNRGRIIWANPAFWELANYQEVATLAEFDRLTGGNVATELGTATPRAVSLRPHPDKPHGERRLFTLTHWKVGHSDTFFIFFEQTGLRHRRLQQDYFETQLVRYLSHISKRLEHSVNLVERAAHPELIQLSEEVHELSQYLQEIHGNLKANHTPEVVDLSRLCDTLLTHLRHQYASQRIHVITTLPHHTPVHGTGADLQTGLFALLEAAFAQARPGDTIRVHLARKQKAALLSITLPERVLGPEEVQSIFHFSGDSVPLLGTKRFFHLKLAVAQQILLKHRGWLRVVSEQGLGTVYEATLAAAE